ncbi:MAG: HAMP domain-containing protein, partial [Caldilineaceae bacterium]|nr:HAMP domain-containing protein [Caldilineaceae bacterium]
MSDPDRSERPREWWRSRMGDPQQHTDWGKEWHARRWHKRRRWFFGRALFFVGFLALLVGGGMAILAMLLTRVFGGDGQIVWMVWLGGCGLSLALPLLALTFGLRSLRRIALPFTDIIAALDAAADGDLSVRVPERGRGEMGWLANSFNRMLGELERTDQQRRNLTADVAHELRTPLHIIQGNLEGILDGVYTADSEHIEATLEETRLLSRLVDDLRVLSLAEAGELPLHREDVDIADLLADVATSFSGQADAQGITLHSSAPQTPLSVHADADRLDQVLSNLVANALRHTPSGGEVVLSAVQNEDTVEIRVRDSGEGIPVEDLPFLFDRFWRG